MRESMQGKIESKYQGLTYNVKIEPKYGKQVMHSPSNPYLQGENMFIYNPTLHEDTQNHSGQMVINQQPYFEMTPQSVASIQLKQTPLKPPLHSNKNSSQKKLQKN